jgi:hypothetical protein
LRGLTTDAITRAALPILRRGDQVLDRVAAAVGDASRTVKFLRGRASFEPRADDVFVASYPRSGTTWTQVIVYLLVSGETEFRFAHLSEVSPWWERSLAWRSDAVDELRALPGPRVFKTHLPHGWLPPGARAVYVWRNPEDVAVSYYHLYRQYLRYQGSFADFFARFLRGDVQYGSWFRHMAGWEAQRESPRILFVPYDEMRGDCAAWVARIASFLELEVSAGRIAEIVRQTEFGHMKAAEDKFDHIGELWRQWGVKTGNFLREGRVTRGAGHISDDQRAALERAKVRPVRYPAIEWRLPAFLH